VFRCPRRDNASRVLETKALASAMSERRSPAALATRPWYGCCWSRPAAGRTVARWRPYHLVCAAAAW